MSASLTCPCCGVEMDVRLIAAVKAKPRRMGNRLWNWVHQHPLHERRAARERVARAAEVSEQAVRHWANGTRPIPAKQIPSISEVTGIPREGLMEDIWNSTADQPEQTAA